MYSLVKIRMQQYRESLQTVTTMLSNTLRLSFQWAGADRKVWISQFEPTNDKAKKSDYACKGNGQLKKLYKRVGRK